MCILTACTAGFLLDQLLGDPAWIYHPIRMIGYLISWLEKKSVSGGRLCQDAQKKRNDALGSDGGDFHDCSVPAFVCGVPHPSGFRLDA